METFIQRRYFYLVFGFFSSMETFFQCEDFYLVWKRFSLTKQRKKANAAANIILPAYVCLFFKKFPVGLIKDRTQVLKNIIFTV